MLALYQSIYLFTEKLKPLPQALRGAACGVVGSQSACAHQSNRIKPKPHSTEAVTAWHTHRRGIRHSLTPMATHLLARRPRRAHICICTSTGVIAHAGVGSSSGQPSSSAARPLPFRVPLTPSSRQPSRLPDPPVGGRQRARVATRRVSTQDEELRPHRAVLAASMPCPVGVGRRKRPRVQAVVEQVSDAKVRNEVARPYACPLLRLAVWREVAVPSGCHRFLLADLRKIPSSEPTLGELWQLWMFLDRHPMQVE
eukprot:CAMPEP_0181180652 /NCGR_PEP_ID=MMETSP1096-20121128/6916_1 /TAXON_ID=156174 ORGANISM="Chrysochromulina ericina, Strain CCMP281" /NCGR_SAMPLE_ID=MMETSP1096 /ASSEMBLY_ACC=CAM_ASM_000453 /LENGTH=254 /DNA_ID=CAMNT_0023269099 /DNA_START=241 /DNA_END=1006 /DNA_ORIENTATION=+